MVVGYAVGFGASIRPVVWASVGSIDHARTVAAEMLTKPGAQLTFEVIRDGKAIPLIVNETKGEKGNGKYRKKETAGSRETCRRIYFRQSAALAG